MLDSTSLVPDDWSGLISRVAGDLDLGALAKETRALVRRRGVPDAQALLRLALARGPGGMSLRQTAAWAHLSGVADLTDASLNDRLHQSCDFLAAIVAKLLAARTPSPCPRWPGRVLRIADGSCVSKPGSRGTDWRVHGVYDLGAGGFSHLELTDKHGGEALDRGAGVEGEIRIADRGYSAAKALRRFVASVEQAKGADYVVRLRWRTRRSRGRRIQRGARRAGMDTRTSDPSQDRRRRSRLLHDVGAERKDDRSVGENRRPSLGDRGQFRNSQERAWPRSQRNALLAWMATSCLARHAGFRHDGDDPRSRQWNGCAVPKKDPSRKDDKSCMVSIDGELIRWSMQEIRRIATRLARKRIRPEFVIAWSSWRRAHQAEARRAYLKKQL